MIRNKIGVRNLLFAMLLIFILFVSAASAQETLGVSTNPSSLEQGLINALNSNTQNVSTDSIVKDYTSENINVKSYISKNANNYSSSQTNLIRDQSFSDQSKLRTYQLENGENITFTDGDLFYISGIDEEKSTSGLSGISETPVLTAKSGFSKTSVITAHKDLYSWTGIHVYSLYTKGYFEYNGRTVKAHHVDSWYKRIYAPWWKVENWEEGGKDYGTSAQIYGRGYFQFGLYTNGNGVTIREFYDNLYIKCDKNGKYKAYFSET